MGIKVNQRNKQLFFLLKIIRYFYMKYSNNQTFKTMKKILLICCLFMGSIMVSNAQSPVAGTPDPVEKAKGLQKELRLTDPQTTKIAAIYKESSQKFEKIKADEHGNTNKMLVKITPLRTATIKKIKAVLTPAQAVKYDKLVKDPKQAGNGWSDGWSSTASS
jgi:protein CpxP